jgi:hypothetical protein
MLQQTVFINIISILQRTQMIQLTERNTIGRRITRARAHDVSGLPALIRVSVIIFVIVCKVQFSYLLICDFSSEIFLKIILLYNFSHELAK